MTSAPVAGPAVDQHAKQIHVEEAGEGPALVFTHGFGGSAATWDAQFAHFSKHYHVLRWDMLGHGLSAAPEDPAEYTRERSLDDLARMIEQMGGEVVLVGHSLGGYLSQHHAMNHPQGIRGVALLATGPGFRDTEKRELWNRRSPKAARMFGLPERAAGLMVQPDDRVMAGLEELTMPVLLLAAERDRQYRNAMEYMKGRIGHAEHSVVPEAGHMLHETHADAVNAVLDPFIASCWS